MQNFGSEVSQLSSLVKTHLADRLRVRAELGIRSHDAVDVGPDFHARSVQNRPNDRCAEVRASATESRGDALGGGADEPAHHWNASQPKQMLDRPPKPFTGQAPDRSCLL